MTVDEVKTVASDVVSAMSGTPSLLFVIVVLSLGVAFLYFDSSEQRAALSSYINQIEINRHSEIESLLETIIACQTELSGVVEDHQAQP